MMDNPLLLHSGLDIPFTEAKLVIHQPTIKEISLIGEDNFRLGCKFLTFSKDLLSSEDKSHLTDKSDFEVLLSILGDKKNASEKNSMVMLLTLLFPEYEIQVTRDKIKLKKDDFSSAISAFNFDSFKDIITEMFILNKDTAGEGYNPADGMAQKIADKFAARKEKLAKIKGKEDTLPENETVYSRYASDLSIGLAMDVNIFMSYTVYQLEYAFARFIKKTEWDLNFEARKAGAQDVEDVDDWMGPIDLKRLS